MKELTVAYAKHVGVEFEYVLVTQGSSEELSPAVLAMGMQGGELVLPWPTFG